jgi:predicted nucleic acid binding AN1-type Zn finger protein
LDDDDYGTAPCPHCRVDVSELAEQCPSCGMYLSAEDSSPSKSKFVWVMLCVCLLIALFWAFGA